MTGKRWPGLPVGSGEIAQGMPMEAGSESTSGGVAARLRAVGANPLASAQLRRAQAAFADGRCLVNQFGEDVALHEAGAPAVVVFYPFAFSRVCTAELGALAAKITDFRERGVRLLGVSVDHKYALRAYGQELFAGQGGCAAQSFDLLADFWPHGALARECGAFDEASGMAGRFTFGVDGSGLVIAGFSSQVGLARPPEAYEVLLELLAQRR